MNSFTKIASDRKTHLVRQQNHHMHYRHTAAEGTTQVNYLGREGRELVLILYPVEHHI